MVILYKNGAEYKRQPVTAKDNWKYSFEDLYKYEEGKEISYTIGEAPIDSYQTMINGYNITNRYVPNIPKKVVVPNTKDNTGIGFYTGCLILSVVGIIVLRELKQDSIMD